ncbi:hypothetical protein V7068_16525 [Bacillus sp. JJ634]
MRNYLLNIWNLVDPIYYRLSHLNYLPDESILRVKLTRYKGKNVILSDGTAINKNDLLIKIHLHNAVLLKELKQIKSDLRRGRFVFQAVRESLPSLVLFIQQHPQVKQIKGIIGITTLNKGANHLGFEVIPITNFFYKWFKWASFLPISLLSRTNSYKHPTPPSYLFMSKDGLTSRYKGH